MTHAQRVAAHFHEDTLCHQVALYHDHIEDRLGNVPDDIRPIVQMLSRNEGEPYKNYINRIAESGDLIAINVKRADLIDNIRRCMGCFDGVVNSNLERRYRWALKRLDAA